MHKTDNMIKSKQDSRIDPSTLTQCLLSCLNHREQDVLQRRYALLHEKKETLDAIGKKYKITRERVRQIERASLNKVKRLLNYREELNALILEIDSILEKYGGIIAHHHLVDELSTDFKDTVSADEFQKQINRLQFLLEEFMSEFYHFHHATEMHKHGWSKEKEKLVDLVKALERIEQFLTTHAKPISHEDIARNVGEQPHSMYAYLNLSNKIVRNPFGLWGLSEWPEVNPKRMGDRVFAVLKEYGKPMHYKDIARHIGKYYNRKTHAPTVHNELIADPRFVLVGRGMYALKDWGYNTGRVKDIVEQILVNSDKPMTREEIVERAGKQRMVARSTILLAINHSSKIRKVGKDAYALKR